MSDFNGELIHGLPKDTLQATSSSFDFIANNMLGIADSYLRPGMAALDIGAGASDATKVLCDNYGMDCFAIDPAYKDLTALREANDLDMESTKLMGVFSPAHAEVYRRYMEGRRGFDEDIALNPHRYIAADARYLPVPTGSIDFILTSVFIGGPAGLHREFTAGVISESIRVLGKGGRFVIGPVPNSPQAEPRAIQKNILDSAKRVADENKRDGIKVTVRHLGPGSKSVEITKR